MEPRFTSSDYYEYTSLRRRLSKSRQPKQGSHRVKLRSRLNHFQKTFLPQPVSPLFKLKFEDSDETFHLENIQPISKSAENFNLENDTKMIDEETENSSKVLSDYSYDQGDTPLSKTKRLNNGVHFWFSKVFHYRNNGLQNWFGYTKESERQKSRYFDQSEAEKQEALPEEAYSCYNQYKTIDFNSYYENLKLDLSSIDDSLRLSIPFFSPLNELTYEALQKMKQEVFGLPEFSKENGLDSEVTLEIPTIKLSPSIEPSADQIDSMLEVVHQFPQNESNILRESTKSSGSSKLLEQFHSDMKILLKNKGKENHQLKSLYQEISDGLEKSCYTPSPNINIFEEGLDSTSTGVSLNDDNLPHNSVLKSTELTESTATANSESYRMSIVAKVKTAFRSEPQTSRSSSNSSYTPVSITIPALKKQSFVFEISEEIANGVPIQPVYQPEDVLSPKEDENTPFDIRDPSAFDAKKESLIKNAEVHDNEESQNTIKFNKFAQVLLYNGTKSLKKPTNQIDQVRFIKFQEKYKNRRSLELTLASSIESLKTRNIRKNKLGLFRVRPSSTSSLHAKRQSEDIIENEPSKYEESSLPNKSILKSRSNRNVNVESARASYLDDVAVDEFLTFFENHEKKRLESEPVLEKYRENQVINYYSENQSSTITNDETV